MPRRVVSEATFDGSLIPETSFESLRSEDSLMKRVDAFDAINPTSLLLNRLQLASYVYRTVRSYWKVEAVKRIDNSLVPHCQLRFHHSASHLARDLTLAPRALLPPHVPNRHDARGCAVGADRGAVVVGPISHLLHSVNDHHGGGGEKHKCEDGRDIFNQFAHGWSLA